MIECERFADNRLRQKAQSIIMKPLRINRLRATHLPAIHHLAERGGPGAGLVERQVLLLPALRRE